MSEVGYIHKHIKATWFFIASLFFATLTAPVAFADTPGSVGSWQTGHLPAAWAGMTSDFYNGYVYAMGGQNLTYNQDVYSAQLGSGGSVGSWATSPNQLPQGLSYATSAIVNGYLYVMGGYNSGGNVVDAVYYSKLGSNGSIGSWQTESTNTLPQAVGYATTFVNNGYIYVVGGEASGGANLATVYYAKPNGDGSMGAWTNDTGNPLPQGLSALSSTVSGNYVYVLGGFAGGYVNTVYYAKLNSNGTIGSWANDTSSPLPQTLQFIAPAANSGYVYVLGGYGLSGPISTAYYAGANSDGSLAAWATSPNSLPQAVFHATSGVYNDYAYVIGGDNGSGPGDAFDTVYYAHLTPTPTPANDPATTASTSSASSSAGPSGPDTGYGEPGRSDPIATMLVAGSIISVGTGLILLYRQKKSRTH